MRRMVMVAALRFSHLGLRIGWRRVSSVLMLASTILLVASVLMTAGQRSPSLAGGMGASAAQQAAAPEPYPPTVSP
jgi:hypothetical protein